MTLVNKIPVLDKGHVAMYSTSLPNALFNEVMKRHFRGEIDSRLTDMTQVIMQIKCPLFVQLSFSEFGLISSTERMPTSLEAYIPNVSEINAQDLETSQMIQQDIETTTEALLMNPESYRHDNCDLFISQVISPISIYNNILVSGSLTAWVRYIEQVSLPRPIESYRKAIEDSLHGEWDRIIQSIRTKRDGKKRR